LKELFEKMLEAEGVQPRLLGYDRPSPKFLKFLEKYYSLSDYVPQNNNFVVFKSYFDKNITPSKKTISQKNIYAQPRLEYNDKTTSLNQDNKSKIAKESPIKENKR
jgi:hypothetical protein